MNRNEIIWVVECLVLNLDEVSKKQMLEFGASEQEAEMGIKLCEYLKNKELKIEVKNGNWARVRSSFRQEENRKRI